VIAGDIFDRSKVAPQVVNRAIRELSQFANGVYAIPGQHDLPYHNYKDIQKSSYWTLCEAGVMQNLAPEGPSEIAKGLIQLHPFPWGFPIRPLPEWVIQENKVNKNHKRFEVAIIHSFIWYADYGYKGAPEEASVSVVKTNLKGYDAAEYGDNHKGFEITISHGDNYKNTWLLNCGGQTPRKSDEREYEPRFGALLRDGTLKTYPYGLCPKWEEEIIKVQKLGEIDIESLMEVLEGIGEQSVDFNESMARYIRKFKISRQVTNILLKAMET
jgi:hypothetical protein